MSFGMELGLGPGDFVFDGPISGDVALDGVTAPPKRAQPPVLVHVYCGQTAGWMKTQIGTEVDLGPGHMVLDGVPAPAKAAQPSTSFRPMSIVSKVAHLSNC